MNTHNTHTPGPWEKNACRVFSDTKRIAEIDTAYMTHDETHSNARLIAAAPAMLEALHGLKKCAAITAERHDIDSSESIWAWISEAQNALMQATGGADQ